MSYRAIKIMGNLVFGVIFLLFCSVTICIIASLFSKDETLHSTEISNIKEKGKCVEYTFVIDKLKDKFVATCTKWEEVKD